MAVRTATTPLEDGWLDYRQMARLPKKDTDEVRAARLAYYAASAHTLALVTESGLSAELVELLLAEIDAFIHDRSAELQP